jgi:hypothetical protein
MLTEQEMQEYEMLKRKKVKHSQYCNAYYHKHKDEPEYKKKHNEMSKRYYQTHKEEVKIANKKYKREYYEKNKEKIIAYNKELYQKKKQALKDKVIENINGEKIKTRTKAYYHQKKKQKQLLNANTGSVLFDIDIASVLEQNIYRLLREPRASFTTAQWFDQWWSSQYPKIQTLATLLCR